jgi:hypothetical protein
MFNKMSEAQRAMLQATIAREDRLLQPSANARGAVAKIFGGKLIEAGWAREVKATNRAPIWRREAASGEAYALKLTPMGVRAVAAAIEATDGNDETFPTTVKQPATKPNGRQSAPAAHGAAATAENARGEKSAAPNHAPRANSKLGRVVGMLTAQTGATIGELTAATGWLEHTTRAALTGLRHRGYALSLTKHERDSASVYRIAARGEEVAK